MPLTCFQALAGPLASACARIAPFTVTLERIEFFAQRRQHATLWLAPEPRTALVALYEALSRALPHDHIGRSAGRAFTPHLTVGQAEERAARDRLLAELRANWQPLQFRVDCISLIARGAPPDDIFRVERELALSAPLAAGDATHRAAPR